MDDWAVFVFAKNPRAPYTSLQHKLNVIDDCVRINSVSFESTSPGFSPTPAVTPPESPSLALLCSPHRRAPLPNSPHVLWFFTSKTSSMPSHRGHLCSAWFLGADSSSPKGPSTVLSKDGSAATSDASCRFSTNTARPDTGLPSKTWWNSPSNCSQSVFSHSPQVPYGTPDANFSFISVTRTGFKAFVGSCLSQIIIFWKWLENDVGIEYASSTSWFALEREAIDSFHVLLNTDRLEFSEIYEKQELKSSLLAR